jgi:hypothetical protein
MVLLNLRVGGPSEKTKPMPKMIQNRICDTSRLLKYFARAA